MHDDGISSVRWKRGMAPAMCWLKYLNPTASKNDYVNGILYTTEKYEMEIY